MTLSELADWADVISALSVVAGLLFVGVQLRQATIQLRRTERNATNAEASLIRQSLFMSGDVAEIATVAVNGSRALTQVEANRMTAFLWEIGFQTIQFWDRTRYGLFASEDFARIVPVYQPYLTSQLGRLWWQTARTVFELDFVADLERLMPTINSPMAAAASDAQAEQTS